MTKLEYTQAYQFARNIYNGCGKPPDLEWYCRAYPNVHFPVPKDTVLIALRHLYDRETKHGSEFPLMYRQTYYVVFGNTFYRSGKTQHSIRQLDTLARHIKCT